MLAAMTFFWGGCRVAIEAGGATPAHVQSLYVQMSEIKDLLHWHGSSLTAYPFDVF